MNREDLEMLADDDTELAETVRNETRSVNDTRLNILSDNAAQALEARAAYIRGRLDV